MTHPELVRRQLEVEEEASHIAQSAVDEAIEAQGVASGSPTVRQQFGRYVLATSQTIDRWLGSQAAVRRKPIALKPLSLLSSAEGAYIALRCLMASVVDGQTGEPPFTKVCALIGKRVRETIEQATFAEQHPDLMKKLDRQLAVSHSEGHRRAVLRAGMRSADFEGLTWEPKVEAAVGLTLVQSAIEATGLFERFLHRSSGKTTAYIRASDSFMALLDQAGANDVLLAPYRYPMVIPPKPWTSVYDGGYIHPDTQPLKFVRARREAAVRMVDAADISDVLDAANAIQATPWTINTRVLDVLHMLQALSDEGTAGLVGKVQPGLPERWWDPEMKGEEWKAFKTEHAEELKAWKKTAKEAYEARASWRSKRLVQGQQIGMAERFRDEVLYFPHSVDFRGRVYPSSGLGAVNPQGNDVGKALLQFARAKPLTEGALDWLYVHAANVWGNDKVSLTDRVLWATMSLDMMLACAADPLLNSDWMQADKPFGFLAVCFEVADYHRDPENAVTRIPVAMDGSCSGLQHFGAMMRCPSTARAVNLQQQQDLPEDVYSVVLRRVEEQVLARRDTDELAAEWVTRLSRNIVKQPVMTTPYGVTSRGIVGQIDANSRKLISKGTIEPFESVDTRQAAIWLAPLVSQAISVEVAAATTAMEWLAHVAKATGSAGLPVFWTTPVGFLAVQEYRETSGKKLEVNWGGQRIEMMLTVDGSTVHARRQVSGLAPNFVHSMDAAHLMVTVNNCEANGIRDFAMIHDSFGCHASDVPLMNAILRESFVQMYSDNVLAGFHDELRQQLPPEVFEGIDPPPEQGRLDLSCVRDSSYFFA